VTALEVHFVPQRGSHLDVGARSSEPVAGVTRIEVKYILPIGAGVVNAQLLTLARIAKAVRTDFWKLVRRDRDQPKRR